MNMNIMEMSQVQYIMKDKITKKRKLKECKEIDYQG
jgi:hypothetical protein